MTAAIANDPYLNIKPIETPLLPFHLGNARIIESKHTFIHYVELKYLLLELENLDIAFKSLEATCKETSTSNTLLMHHINTMDLLTHAKYFINEVRIKLNNIKPHSRAKRGLINVVGKASKWLFSTLDADDGERYEQAINELKLSQNSYKKELNLQISLTKDLINNYNSTISILSKNQNSLKVHVQILAKNLNKTINDFTVIIKL